jgi:DNA adenine methylase
MATYQVLRDGIMGARPVLRWAGSKRQLVPILSQYWIPRYRRYVEPFVGSAALFFRLAPKKALLGDINSELMATYKAIREDPHAVIDSLRRLRLGKETFYRLRGLDPERLQPTARASRFVFLNRQCFNGLYRTNKSGRFNVPYGGARSGQMPSGEHFLICSELLSRAELVSSDFEKVLEKTRPGDFVYMDPPYCTRARRVFNEYDRTVFGATELSRLKVWMRRLDRQGIAFVVSYAECEESSYLAEGFDVRVARVRRNIAGFTKSRVSCNEVLISNCPRGNYETS